MASKAHQFIANMISIKMRQLGYEVVTFDGKQIYLSEIKLKTPPCIKRHRPDLIGFDSVNKRLCIGDAKTVSDLGSERTSEQIKDYSTLIISKKPVRFIIGIPLSGYKKLKEVLHCLGLEDSKNIMILKIPDRLLPNENRI